ncbi:ribosome assembly cofactor RimP [Mycoplasmopsis sturni]|uniref:ribosome assembly cofactor RimP n=1 Tax=Mycoplasmopsis sturni TaxID=39047 RepID=UPI000560AB0B|nr:ribosome assembly cofactor RimP [Mycoplasmopsis sturni]
MDYLKLLKKELGDKILSASFKIEPFAKTLTIEVDSIDLDEVTAITKEVQALLEAKNLYPNDLQLEVLSKGNSTDIDLDKMNEFVGQTIKLIFYKSVEKEQIMVGDLIGASQDSFILKWNQKGRIRKLNIAKSEVKSAEVYIKF